MLLMMEQCFSSIAVNVENADWHRHAETNGSNAITADSDNDSVKSFFQGVEPNRSFINRFYAIFVEP